MSFVDKVKNNPAFPAVSTPLPVAGGGVNPAAVKVGAVAPLSAEVVAPLKSAAEIVAEWWSEVKVALPAPHLRSSAEHIEEQLDSLVKRLTDAAW